MPCPPANWISCHMPKESYPSVGMYMNSSGPGSASLPLIGAIRQGLLLCCFIYLFFNLDGLFGFNGNDEQARTKKGISGAKRSPNRIIPTG